MKKIVCMLFILVVSCSSIYHTEKKVSFIEMIPVIREYVYSNPQYNTFLLKTSDEDQFSVTQFPSGYTIGPFYKDMFAADGVQIDSYIDIGNNRIYIMLNNSVKKNPKFPDWINRNQKDSCIVDSIDSIWQKSPWINYIVRSIFIYKDGDSIVKLSRPDTIFIIPRVASSINFSIDSI